MPYPIPFTRTPNYMIMLWSVMVLGIAATACHPNEVAPAIPMVTTLAGSSFGTADGQGGQAKFGTPCGIIVSASGDLLVADQFNNSIRRITSSGLVSTLSGLQDISGMAALLKNPLGLVLDVTGNLFVVGNGQNTILRIDPSGVVTTWNTPVAGSSIGVVIDAQGNLFIADRVKGQINKFTDGMLTVYAGKGTTGFTDGPALQAEFKTPQGLAIDGSGNLYVSDTGNGAIRKISTNGMVTTLAGNGTAGFANGKGKAAMFNAPAGLALDHSGNVYVADYYNSVIRKITPQGWVSTYAGSGTHGAVDGPGDVAQFYEPLGVDVDQEGNVYVTDTYYRRIRKIAR